jgi:hypothetical protein
MQDANHNLLKTNNLYLQADIWRLFRFSKHRPRLTLNNDFSPTVFYFQ